MADDASGGAGAPRYDADAGLALDWRPGTGATRGGTAGTGATRGGTAGGTRGGTAASRPVTAATSATAGGGGGGGAYNVVCLIENRGREVGAAIVNLRALHTIELVQLVDTPSYSGTQALLAGVSPVEIVMPKSQSERVLFKKVRERAAERCMVMRRGSRAAARAAGGSAASS